MNIMSLETLKKRHRLDAGFVSIPHTSAVSLLRILLKRAEGSRGRCPGENQSFESYNDILAFSILGFRPFGGGRRLIKL